MEESFVGEMSQMVMFDYALSPDEVVELATPQNASCAAVYGQLLSWTDVLIGQRHGDVIVVNQSRCLGQHFVGFFEKCTYDFLKVVNRDHSSKLLSF